LFAQARAALAGVHGILSSHGLVGAGTDSVTGRPAAAVPVRQQATNNNARLPNSIQVPAPPVISHRRPVTSHSVATNITTSQLAGSVPIDATADGAIPLDDQQFEFEGSATPPHDVAVEGAAIGVSPHTEPVITMRHRLRNNLGIWSSVVTSTLVLSWIASGFPLLWKNGVAPPNGIVHRNHPSAFEHAEFVDVAVRELLATSTIIVQQNCPPVVCAIGVVDKKGGKFRLIWDGRPINEFLVCPTFKYETLKQLPEWAQLGDFVFTTDLSAGYHHVDLAQDAWQYISFQWRGVYYSFTQLPFGLAPACWAFTRVTRAVLQHFRQQGVRCSGYIDDALWLHQDANKLLSIQYEVLQLFKSLGFRVNMKKSHLSISHEAPYLGMQVDFAAGIMTVPADKREALVAAIHLAISNRRRVPVRSLAAIKGRLISMHFALGHAAFFFTKALDQDIAARSSWAAHVKLSPTCVRELVFWLSHFHKFDGTWPMFRSGGFDVTIEMDAAGATPDYVGGWGAVLKVDDVQPAHAHGQWSPIESEGASSTALELRAVHNALQSFNVDDQLFNKHVRVITDSQNVHTHLTTGRVVAVDSVAVAQDIFLYCFNCKIQLQVDWVPREQNVVADKLSKLTEDGDFMLCRDLFARIQRSFGPFSCDLFASATNHHLPKYFSRFFTPTSSGVDAFAQQWQGLCWAHPPYDLINRVLQYASQAAATICLLCPFWPSASWWLKLCSPDGVFNKHVHGVYWLPAHRPTLFTGRSGHRLPVGKPWRLVALHMDYSRSCRHRLRLPKNVLQRDAS
jgi:ribonuclease HI